MPDQYTPHEVITAKLRVCTVPGVVWGPTASPFYEERPQQADATFPWVVFEIPDSVVEHTQGPPYKENYEVTFTVVGTEATIMALASPYAPNSVTRFLDGFRDVPEQLNGTGFECEEFLRQSWVVHRDPTVRAPGAGSERVWVATLKYGLWVTAQ